MALSNTSKGLIGSAAAMGMLIAATVVFKPDSKHTAQWPPGPGSITDCNINGGPYTVRLDVLLTSIESGRLRYGPCYAGAQIPGCNDNNASLCPDRRGKRCIPEEYEGGWASNWFNRELGRFPEQQEVEDVGVICGLASAMQRDNLAADPLPTLPLPTADPTATLQGPTPVFTPSPTPTPSATPCPPQRTATCKISPLTARSTLTLSNLPKWVSAADKKKFVDMLKADLSTQKCEVIYSN